MGKLHNAISFATFLATLEKGIHCKLQESRSVKLPLHDGIYRLRFYSNSLIHILSLSTSHNNVASIQKNRGDKSHLVMVALNVAILGCNLQWFEKIFAAVTKGGTCRALQLVLRSAIFLQYVLQWRWETSCSV